MTQRSRRAAVTAPVSAVSSIGAGAGESSLVMRSGLSFFRPRPLPCGRACTLPPRGSSAVKDAAPAAASALAGSGAGAGTVSKTGAGAATPAFHRSTAQVPVNRT